MPVQAKRYAQLEVDRRRPRTLETLVLVDGGVLYVAANFPQWKRWPSAIREDPVVRARLGDERVYALRARYIESESRTRALLQAMIAKYGFDVSLGGPIWFFALEPASGLEPEE